MAFHPSTRPGDIWEAFDQLRRDLGVLGARAPRARAAAAVHPLINLYENAEGLLLTAEVPGVAPDDLDLRIETNRVTLRGERRASTEQAGDASVHRRERATGRFARSVELPTEIDPDAAEARYRHGILSVQLPKHPERRPRQVKVQTS